LRLQIQGNSFVDRFSCLDNDKAGEDGTENLGDQVIHCLAANEAKLDQKCRMGIKDTLPFICAKDVRK
jgi:hypothetical protein